MTPQDAATRLVTHRYGKSRVRLMKVNREAAQDRVVEWTVQILLEGDFESTYRDGDNSRILPTDTMKNTVYSRARASTATTMEQFAMELGDFFLERNPQVWAVEVSIEGAPWQQLEVEGRVHPSAFLLGGREVTTAVVRRVRSEAVRAQPACAPVEVISGLRDLQVLKTAGSSFEGYLRDSLTTLKESTDRLLGTAIEARWHFAAPGLETAFEEIRAAVRTALLETFAAHQSKSVQQTLYAMGEAALRAAPAVEQMDLVMPNRHCLLVDLSPFGQTNPNQIFMPTDEPHGTLEASIRRGV